MKKSSKEVSWAPEKSTVGLLVFNSRERMAFTCCLPMEDDVLLDSVLQERFGHVVQDIEDPKKV
jgi:hypothetical protein